MAEAIFHMKKGTEFPESFAGAEIRHFSPDKPADENDWDGVLRALRECYDDALSAHAGTAASYNLDRQKGIKAAAAETIGEGDAKRHRTVAELQDWALKPENQKIKRRLRGESTGEKKASSGKIKTKAQVEGINEMLADPELDPATRSFLEARKARLEALGVNAETAANASTTSTNGEASTEAPAKETKNNKNRK